MPVGHHETPLSCLNYSQFRGIAIAPKGPNLPFRNPGNGRPPIWHLGRKCPSSQVQVIAQRKKVVYLTHSFHGACRACFRAINCCVIAGYCCQILASRREIV